MKRIILALVCICASLNARVLDLSEFLSQKSLSVALANKTVIIKCWMNGCPPCMRMRPLFEKVAEKYADGSIVFIDCNIQEDRGLISETYQVYSVPTLLVFKNNELIHRSTGFQSQKNIENLVRSL
ncbi:MAG: Thioredoxin [candidate division TM6 bacterium GW2011_GWE2_41_16]|nr:MAG: Thioredoxin [candidate division TM6 bacterium GW2011_GWE2_41_16]